MKNFIHIIATNASYKISYSLWPSSTMEKHSTCNTKIDGSNPADGTRTESNEKRLLPLKLVSALRI